MCSWSGGNRNSRSRTKARQVLHLSVACMVDSPCASVYNIFPFGDVRRVWISIWIDGSFFALVLVTNCWDYKLFQLGSERRINTKLQTLIHKHIALYTLSTCGPMKEKKYHTKQGLISICDNRRLSIGIAGLCVIEPFLNAQYIEIRSHHSEAVWCVEGRKELLTPNHVRIMDALNSTTSFLQYKTCFKQRKWNGAQQKTMTRTLTLSRHFIFKWRALIHIK